MRNFVVSIIVVFLVLCVPWFCVAQAGWFDSECKQAIIDSRVCDVESKAGYFGDCRVNVETRINLLIPKIYLPGFEVSEETKASLKEMKLDHCASAGRTRRYLSYRLSHSSSECVAKRVLRRCVK